MNRIPQLGEARSLLYQRALSSVLCDELERWDGGRGGGGWAVGGREVQEGGDICAHIAVYRGFPGGSDGKESACNVGDLGSIPGSGRSPGEGNGNPLYCSCLENHMDRGAWWATVHGVAKSHT